MAENRLNIIQSESQDRSSFESAAPLSRNARQREMKARYERAWLTNPERFNPLRNCMERERLDRTEQFITKHIDLVNKQTADIGSGAGVFSRRLRDLGAQVEAIDIAENALKLFEKNGSEGIKLKQDAMPDTSLPDHFYDLIVCTELIAEIPKEDYRLFFAELSRLIKGEGHLVCSSSIDIDTDGGVEKLAGLAQTEFEILDDESSYHALYLRVKRFFEAPAFFSQGWKKQESRSKELSSRRGLNKGWYWLNSSPAFGWFWTLIEPCTRPIHRFLKNSRRFMLFLEKICRFTSDQAGVSHYLFIAKRRPIRSVDPSDIPIEKPHRKEIWD